jgi:hypothetical protein
MPGEGSLEEDRESPACGGNPVAPDREITIFGQAPTGGGQGEGEERLAGRLSN